MTTDPRIEAAVSRLMTTHPSWFEVPSAAHAIAELVLTAADAADKAAGVRRVTQTEWQERWDDGYQQGVFDEGEYQ